MTGYCVMTLMYSFQIFISINEMKKDPSHDSQHRPAAVGDPIGCGRLVHKLVPRLLHGVMQSDPAIVGFAGMIATREMRGVLPRRPLPFYVTT